MSPPCTLASRIGRYELVERLAGGRLTERFLGKATFKAVQQVVRLKRLRPEHARRHQHVEALLDEGRIAAQLSHPGLPRLVDVGSAEGGFFLAYEHVRGCDLRTMIGEAIESIRQVPLSVAIHLTTQAAAALHDAHEQQDLDGRRLQLVHGALASHNVFVTQSGMIKLLDFAGIDTGPANDHQQSPEQWHGDPIDRRADVFALGVVLFELTLGRSPFFANSAAETRRKIVEEPLPRPTALLAGYPIELERIVLRAMARNRDERFRTAEELQVALERFARDCSIALSTSTTRQFLRSLFGGGGRAWGRGSLSPKASQHRLPALSITGQMPAVEIGTEAIVADVLAPPPLPRRRAPGDRR